MTLSRGACTRLVLATALCAVGFLPVAAIAAPPTTDPATPSTESVAPESTDVSATAPDTTEISTTTMVAPSTEVTTSTPVTAVAPDTTAEPTTTAVSTTTAAAITPSVADQEASISPLAVATPTVSNVRAAQTLDDMGYVKYRVVRVAWSGAAEYYEVHRRASGSSAWVFVSDSGSSSVDDTFYEGTDVFGWYTYRVTPYSLDYDTYEYVYGAPRAVSINVTNVAYPPSLPRSVRATATTTTVTVSWTAPTTTDYYCEGTSYYFCDPATSYIVSWAPTGGTWSSVTTTGTSRTLSGLRSGTTYYINVRAVNATGRSAATPSIQVTPFTVPGGMSQMEAYPHNGYVNLYWSAPASNGAPITRYVIQRRRSGSSTWQYISYDTPGSARSFTAWNLTNGTVYSFRIAAINAAGMGAWSYPISVRPRTVPSAPIGLSVQSNYSGHTLRWNAPYNGGSPIVDYRIQVWDPDYYYSYYYGYTGAWVTVSDGVSTSTASFVYSPGYGCEYLRVAAVNTAGVGTYSGSVQGCY